MSCSNNTLIDIQGHRGCRGLLPENSLPAFKKALDLGVHTLELDLAISKDKKVVVSHEPYLNHEIALDLDGNEISRANEKLYNLYQMTYDNIKQYDCGSKIHPRFPHQDKIEVYKPLLSDVFALAEKQNPNIKYNIEIKSLPEYDGIYAPNPEEFTRLVLAEIEKANVAQRTNLQSFDLRTLEVIQQQSKAIKIALLVDEDENIAKKLAKLSYMPEIISPYFELLDKKIVKEYQTLGYQVIPWTVNEVADMQSILDMHVDGIITDYPDRLINILNPEE